MKKNEIKNLSADEINKKINLLKKELFNARFKKINGQLDNTAIISQNKRSVAKLLNALNNKK